MGTSAAIALALLLLPGQPVPPDAARERASALVRMLPDPNAADADLLAAVASVEEAWTDLAAGPDQEKVRRDLETALLRAAAVKQVPKRSKENARHAVQVRAARALGRCGPRAAEGLRALLQGSIFKDRDYDPLPAFYEAAFDALVRIDRDRSVEWLVREVVNADNQPDSVNRLVAALRAMRKARDLPGNLRYGIVDRCIQLFQAPEFWWPDDYQEVAGYRNDARRPLFAGTYWIGIRSEVIETLWRFSVDPRTGLPPADYNDGSDVDRVGRYLVWFANNKQPGNTPWPDVRKPSDRRPRLRADALPVRPPVNSIEWKYGVPWTAWWESDRPRAVRPTSTEPAVAPAAGALATDALPPLLRRSLLDPAEEVRAVAAVFTGKLGVAGAAEALRAVLDTDSSETVREGALLGLLHLRDPAQREFLRGRAGDGGENPRVRGFAILALGFLGDADGARERLLAKAVPSDPVPPDLLACSLRALGIARAPGDGHLLAGLLAGPALPASVRGHAGTALLRFRDPASLPDLLRVLAERAKDRDRRALQAGAAVALAGASGPADLKRLSPVTEVVHEPDGRFAGARNLVVLALGRIGGPAVHEFLAEEYRRCKVDARRYAERGWFLIAFGLEGSADARALLEGELRTLDHDRDRAACAVALALAKDDGAIPAIRALLADEGREFLPWGMAALAHLKDRGAIPIVRGILARRSGGAVLSEGAEALAILLGDQAGPELMALWERCASTGELDAVSRALGISGAKAAVDPLLAILADQARLPEERALALAALGRMAEPGPTAVAEEFARDFDPYAEGDTLVLLHRSADVPFLLAEEK